MEPLLFDVRSLLVDSIFVKEIDVPYLEDQFHFHNAYEIALIISGTGKRIIGDSIERFTDGDLVFLGPHIAHVSRFEEQKNNIKALVIYFHPDWFSESYYSSVNLMNLKRLLRHAQRGLKLSAGVDEQIRWKMIEILPLTGFKKLIHFLDILDIVSSSTDNYHFLASEGYSNSYVQKDVKRMDKVYEYVYASFTDKIHLDKIASVASMTPTSFCKFFKSKTGKTFSTFVNEMRIGYSCKLLCNEDLSISQVCFKCGFNNLTNFNRNFKSITGLSPSDYKEKIRS